MSFSIQSVYNWYRNTLRNPKYRWWIVLGTLAYLISPIDISPDFIPIAGQIDDVAIAALLVTEISQIALDYYKARKAKADEVCDPTVDTAGDATVEVNAVSVK